MKVTSFENDLKLGDLENIDLSQTFDCGQCFRWYKNSGNYTGIFKGRVLTLFQSGNEITFKNKPLKLAYQFSSARQPIEKAKHYFLLKVPSCYLVKM